MRVDCPIFCLTANFFLCSVLSYSLHVQQKSYMCRNWLSSPDLKTALNDINKNFLVIPIDKATDNTAVVCKRFYTYVTGKELEVTIHSEIFISKSTT